MDTIIPIGIYCYFEIDLLFESCEVSVSQYQSVNKRYLNMSETYPRKNLCETLFAGHIPSAQVCDCKGNTFFAYKQIEKYFLLEILIYTCIY